MDDRSSAGVAVQAVVDAMSDDPAAHNIPNGLHYQGAQGMKEIVGWYPTGEVITCDDLTTTNGFWSAAATTLDSPYADISLIRLTVQRHVEGKIHRQYFFWTQWSGTSGWGLPLEGRVRSAR